MWIAVNCVLLMLAAVVTFIGIQFFIRNRETSNYTRIYVLFYSIFSALWCLSYGTIGIVDDIERAPYIRILGVMAIDGFNVVEVFLVSGMNNSNRLMKRGSRIFILLLAILDFVTFSNTKMDNFVRMDNWTTWYSNPELGSISRLHTIIIFIMMFHLLALGIAWLKNSKLKRQKKFIIKVFIANYIMFFFSIPDTMLPVLNLPAVATSGIGAAICTMVIWYGASQYNSFDIKMGNVVKNIYNFINAGVLVFDMDKHLTMANPYSLSFIPEGNLNNKSLEDIFAITEKRRDELFASATKEIQTERFEALKNGNIYSIRISVAVDDYNEPYCYICALMDVTDELNMVKNLEIANNAKANFLTSISHEIRTPINAVLGFNEMIACKTDDVDIIHYSDSISRAGNHLLSLISDLLDMGQISSGEMKIIPMEYELSRLLSDVFMLHTLKADEKHLEFTISNDRYIPNVLFGDAVRIKQIITNLISNAIKYTDKGTVRMQAEYKEMGDDKIELVISVSDTGIGIKKEDIPKLYDSFTRFDADQNRQVEGTGVGLSITKSLVEKMNGTIEVESEYGAGSTFTVKIVQKVINREPIGVVNYANGDEASLKKEETLFTAPDAKVLVVDDNEMNLFVFGGLLEPLKLNIVKASSGMEMLKVISKEKFDLIFLDHMMPGMDGIETLRRMKEDKDHPNQDTPVIVMTANAIIGAKEQYISEGFTDYVGKPAQKATLEKMVKQYLAPELIIDNSQTLDAKDDSNVSEGDKLPLIDGIEWSLAFANVPNVEMVMELINTFCAISDQDISVLEENYEILSKGEDEEAFSAYRIKVHSMKNSAALVGAKDLSSDAKVLEYAARDKDRQTIIDNHASFVRDYKNISDVLMMKVLGKDVSVKTKKNIMSAENLLINLDMMEAAMEEFDTDALNEMSYVIDNYDFESEEILKYVMLLKDAVRDFDKDNFDIQISTLRRILK